MRLFGVILVPVFRVLWLLGSSAVVWGQVARRLCAMVGIAVFGNLGLKRTRHTLACGFMRSGFVCCSPPSA